MPQGVQLSFGPFVFDPVSRDIRKNGQPIRLDAQAADLLAFLLEQPGVLVTYAQIRARLWENDTHVGYGVGIRRCVVQIRAALGDDASTPTYIETIRKRGYRFLAPVQAPSPKNAAPSPEAKMETEPALILQPPIPRAFPSWSQRYLFAGAGLGVFGVLVWAVLACAYGLAMVAFVVGAGIVVLIYRRSDDTQWTRARVAIYLLAAMCYVCNASTLPEVQATVVNLSALPPALSYQFILGLRFIPLYVLVLGYWTFRGGGGRRPSGAPPGFEKTYTLLGILFLSATIMSLVIGGDDDHAWNAGSHAREILVAGYATAFLINAAVWAAGLRSFRTGVAFLNQPLLSFCAMTYVPLAFVAFVTDSEQNRINRYELDIRRPEAYRVANPEAIEDLDKPARKNLQADIGPDLRNLLRDASFREALSSAVFYRQPWDEPFQLLHRSVMFGFRRQSSSHERPPFVIIRFPRELADELRFQPTGNGPNQSALDPPG